MEGCTEQIKRGQTVYPEEEISAFAYALNELGISDLSELEGYDFAPAIPKPCNIRLP